MAVNMNYILDGKKPVPEPNILKWAIWMEAADRHVVQDYLLDGVNVSTIFLGLDYGFGYNDHLFFETMIFGGDHDGYQERYSTWEEAEEGHKKAIELVFSV
jgi:hypothetical protein